MSVRVKLVVKNNTDTDVECVDIQCEKFEDRVKYKIGRHPKKARPHQIRDQQLAKEGKNTFERSAQVRFQR